MSDWAKYAIIVAACILAALGLWIWVIPDGTKTQMTYTLTQTFNKKEYAKIERMQNAKILGHEKEKFTYEEILQANGTNVYWGYDTRGLPSGQDLQLFDAYAEGVTITIGENDDGGAYDDATLRLEFQVYPDNRYDLGAYMNGVKLSSDDRDALLSKMISRTKK